MLFKTDVQLRPYSNIQTLVLSCRSALYILQYLSNIHIYTTVSKCSSLWYCQSKYLSFISSTIF